MIVYLWRKPDILPHTAGSPLAVLAIVLSSRLLSLRLQNGRRPPWRSQPEPANRLLSKETIEGSELQELLGGLVEDVPLAAG